MTIWGCLLLVSLVSVAGDTCGSSDSMRCYRKFPKLSFYMQCPSRYAVAVYDFKDFIDLRGKVNVIQCLRMGSTKDCRWNGPVNALGQAFDFKCHTDALITAIKYNYDGGADDGTFEIQCCKIKGRSVTNCQPWGEETSFTQYMRASSVGFSSSLPMPGIAGFNSTPSSRNGIGYSYKTRDFIVKMCNVGS